jgi:hypothetical protein
LSAEELLKLESKAKEIISKLQGVVDGIDPTIAEKAREGVYHRDNLYALEGVFMDMAGRLHSIENKFSGLYQTSKKLLHENLADASAEAMWMAVEASKYIRGKCDYDTFSEWIECKKVPSLDLRMRADYIKSKTGRACGNLILTEDELSIPAMADGVTNCVHVVAEEITKVKEDKIPGTEKCYVVGKPNPDAERLCKMWDNFTERFKGIYYDEDMEALSGFVSGDRVGLRVGSAMGHATEVDVGKGTVEYLDRDYAVNRVVKAGLEAAGAKCGPIIDGVKCEFKGGIKGKQIDKTAYVISQATSMDIRINDLKDDVEERNEPIFSRAIGYAAEDAVHDRVKRNVEEERYEHFYDEKLVDEASDLVFKKLRERIGRL